MEQQPNKDLPNYSQQQLQEITVQLARCKGIMFEILQRSPKIGVYKGQSRQDWQSFFKYFINFLKSQIGPRGECAKQIRKKLVANHQVVNKLLAPFNLNAQNHIRQILMKIKRFVPCQQYPEVKRIESARQKFKINLDRFQDQNSEMVKHITEGLVSKHGKQYDIKPQLAILKQNYVNRVKEADQSLAKLRQILDKCEGYHQLIAAQTYLQPYFVEWKAADSDIGKQNLKTGQLFEEKVFKVILPYIFHRQKSDKNWVYSQQKLQVFTNLQWIPRNLGQIDIALGYKDQKQNRYFITTLIECKSRFFDLREAYRQVSLQQNNGINNGPTFQELKQMKKIKMKLRQKKSQKQVLQNENTKEKSQDKQQQTKQQLKKQQEKNGKIKMQGKKFLSTKFGPAQLVKNHHFYIITTLPHNEFVLPIESKLKEGIQKFTRNMFIQDIKSEPLYLSLKQKFQNALSPLDWLRQYEARWKGQDSNIVVLK